MARVVWVLGAGFSRALGGPLLPELLSPESFRDINNAYPGSPGISSHYARLAMRLYHYGRRFKDGLVDPDKDAALVRDGLGELLWDHAEMYLDKLETAAANLSGPLASRLVWICSRLLPDDLDAPNLPAMRDAARRIVALECSRFLKGATTDEERWTPYRNWSKLVQFDEGIGLRHTLISFNYDLVLEKLGFGETVLLPHSAKAKPPEVLKLHGSVDWSRNGDTWTRADEDHAATCEDKDLHIATPGPGKLEAGNLFGSLWDLAAKRLEKASAVVFIGFRFPPSDAMARVRFLGALRGSKAQVHIVLGDDANHPHCRRMAALLRYVSGREPMVHPLFAEDLLGILDSEMLGNWATP